MSLRVEDKHLSKNYNKIWKITERLMSIDFESKEKIPCKCLSIIMLDSVIEVN